MPRLHTLVSFFPLAFPACTGSASRTGTGALLLLLSNRHAQARLSCTLDTLVAFVTARPHKPRTTTLFPAVVPPPSSPQLHLLFRVAACRCRRRRRRRCRGVFGVRLVKLSSARGPGPGPGPRPRPRPSLRTFSRCCVRTPPLQPATSIHNVFRCCKTLPFSPLSASSLGSLLRFSFPALCARARTSLVLALSYLV